MTDDYIEVYDALGRVLGWLPTHVARAMGIDVTESRTPITTMQRRMMQAHPEFDAAREEQNQE